jgi:GalNAc-alpha-(1->4)-GalNAc-alpha-(1->3)-diNAcBac-PP-undecaprenol alpha-1,4-N-acetyl-D-galactosaminyltransferase
MSENKKKICLIAPSLQMGGLERAMSTLANYFVTQGHEIYFITIFPFEPFFKLDSKITHLKCNYNYSRKSSFIKMLEFYPKIFSPFKGFIRNKIKDINPDVIMSFGDIMPQLSMISLYGLNIPFYLSNRSSPAIKYPLFIRLLKIIGYIIVKPTGVIAQTTAAADRKRRILGRNANIKIIPNVVRPLIKTEVKKENWIITIGRLHKEKGIDRLFDVFKKIQKPDWKLVIVGKGKHETEIINYSKQLGISENVIFVGKIENIEEILSQARIFVLPSYGEGFPNALCEAMSIGLPCLSFDIIAGPRDIIEDNVNGFLIKDGDIDSMVNKINYLIDNPLEQEQLGNEARKIVDKFSLDKVGTEYLNFILNKNEQASK